MKTCIYQDAFNALPHITDNVFQKQYFSLKQLVTLTGIFLTCIHATWIMRIKMKRKHLTWEEIHCLLKTIVAEGTTYRDYCMVSMAFLHGLRASELTGLTLDDYSPLSRTIFIRRLKGGLCSEHPLLPEENTALQRWLQQRQYTPGQHLPWLFFVPPGRAAITSAFLSAGTRVWQACRLAAGHSSTHAASCLRV